MVVEREFFTKNVREVSIAIGDFSYLLIFGRHINGMFLCIPNWAIGCELSGDPTATYYNTNKIEAAGLDRSAAKGIAEAIAQLCEGRD